MPWELRVISVRLQGIGYGDTRRGISGYYDLARDAREEIVRTTGEDRQMWRERLEDLGVRVGNALVEMGDFGGAARHLESLRTNEGINNEMLNGRLAMLYLRLGDVTAARRYIETGTGGSSALQPLLSMAEGRYEDAVSEWRALREDSKSEMITQNLAVCLLYTGHAEEVSSQLFLSFSPLPAAMLTFLLGSRQHRSSPRS